MEPGFLSPGSNFQFCAHFSQGNAQKSLYAYMDLQCSGPVISLPGHYCWVVASLLFSTMQRHSADKLVCIPIFIKILLRMSAADASGAPSSFISSAQGTCLTKPQCPQQWDLFQFCTCASHGDNIFPSWSRRNRRVNKTALPYGEAIIRYNFSFSLEVCSVYRLCQSCLHDGPINPI